MQFRFVERSASARLSRRLVDQIKALVSKICGDQIVRTPASTDVKLRSRGAYHITVAIERIQKARLVAAGIRLDSPQCVFLNKE